MTTINYKETVPTPHLKTEVWDDRKLYRLLYDSITIAVVVLTDEKGNILRWNKGAENTFGYSQEEVLGCSFSILIEGSFGKPSFLDLVACCETNSDNSKEGSFVLECKHSSGQFFPAEVVISKLEPTGLYAIKMLDISERTAYQNELKRKTRELEMFLYRSAHDLNAPFSSAQGLIDLIKGESSLVNIRLLMGKLEKTINCAKVLAEGLEKASLVNERGRNPEIIDFSMLIGTVLEGLRTLRGTKEIEFQIKEEGSYEFVSNPDLIFAVLRNVIQNAIQFSLPVEKAHKPFVDIRVSKREIGIEITVRDNGKGIKGENIDRIFDMYFKEETREPCEANGLGLYIVKRIIECLNGNIYVQSSPGVGTNFQIQIPNIPIK
ncbi:MAG TPA: hypothetical protein DEF18_16335, partial [Muricauda sp.]|nr:PAS domain-containing sensor histidine kinase [uncultured Allomuricauda sp.]HBU79667.1 hypothetical protein [Allomuricauda sp.]|tara:strand:+ start:4775 stop:5908 length:1134 start_codon:yes stop_codon:yes gene_type:complete